MGSLLQCQLITASSCCLNKGRMRANLLLITPLLHVLLFNILRPNPLSLPDHILLERLMLLAPQWLGIDECFENLKPRVILPILSHHCYCNNQV